MNTLVPQPAKVKRAWHFIDAKGQVLGRLATQAAVFLMGKQKTDFARHVDWGDHVVIINAAEVVATGHKATQKLYHRHSGYPGGMTVTTLEQVRASHPDRIILHAVTGMLPDNKLRASILSHLHIYPGPEHPYAQHFKN